MDIWGTIGQSAILIFVLMTFFFLVSLGRKKNDIADFVWGFGLIFVAISTLISIAEPNFRAVLVTSLVVIWGLRLSFHIYFRNKKKEDFRLRKWQEKWGKYFVIKSYFQLFLLQGFLLLLVSLPVIVVNSTTSNPNLFWFDALGIIIWFGGFIFETIGDYQLSRFVKSPNKQGRIMTSGLWRYSRHPNYFGEIVQWLGIFLIALSSPYWWLSVLGPITIIIIIFKVSGISMMEKKYEGDLEFEKYKKITNKLIPSLPKINYENRK